MPGIFGPGVAGGRHESGSEAPGYGRLVNSSTGEVVYDAEATE
jgi:hypothetical protein